MSEYVVDLFLMLWSPWESRPLDLTGSFGNTCDASLGEPRHSPLACAREAAAAPCLPVSTTVRCPVVSCAVICFTDFYQKSEQLVFHSIDIVFKNHPYKVSMKLWWQFAFCPVQFLVTWILLIKSVTLHGLCSLGLFFHPGVSFPSFFFQTTLCVFTVWKVSHMVCWRQMPLISRGVSEKLMVCVEDQHFLKRFIFFFHQ